MGLIANLETGWTLAVAAGSVSPGAGFGVGLLVVVFGLPFASLVGQTVRGIAKTALYRYAREGTVPEEFDDFDVETLGGRTERRAIPEDRRVEGRI
jgi:hypothetical protein